MKKITDINCLDGEHTTAVVFTDKDVPDKRVVAFKRNGQYWFFPQYWQPGIPCWMYYMAFGDVIVRTQDLTTAMQLTTTESFEKR